MNPGTYLTDTTWVAWGSGRVPVGVSEGDAIFGTVEKTGGEKTHTLVESEMPVHSHRVGMDHGGVVAVGSGSGASFTLLSKGEGSEIDVISSGGGNSHNNLQPFITCYMWKRTA